MIGKITEKSTGSFKNRIEYIFGLRKHEHALTQIRTIAKNCLAPDPLRHGHNRGNIDVLGMIEEFDSVERMRSGSIDSERKIKPVWHAILALPPGESLTDQQWKDAVQVYMNNMGFDESCKWVAVLHGDTDSQHVHIVANRIRLDETFSMVKDSNERRASCDSTSDIEDMFNLTKAPSPTETWGTAITRAELDAAERNGDIPRKHKMIAKIAGAVEITQAAQGDMFMLIRLLRRQRVFVHFTKNANDQPKGIAYEFQGVVIAGRKLKRSRLTFQKLTTQEGISYDPETFQALEIEAARRDQDDQNHAAERFWYFSFYSRTRRFAVKFEPKSRSQREIDELVEAIQAFLSAIFGVPFESKKERERRDAEYLEYIPMVRLTREMFGIRDRQFADHTYLP